jgi:DNA-binding transcriptional ArsR family regulator
MGGRLNWQTFTADAATENRMEAVFWYVFTGTRGGAPRIRIVRALDERPRTATQLAADLDLTDTTIRHHLGVLLDNEILTNGGSREETVYRPSERARQYWDTIETIREQGDHE